MRLLVLTHRLPYAPNRGDRIRSYHLLRLLSRRHEVHLVSLAHDEEEARQVSRMRELAASVSVARVPRVRNLARVPLALAGAAPLTHVLLDSPDMTALLSDVVRRVRPELVIAYCSGMARFALEPPLDRLPFILDMVDVDSQKWAALADRSRAPRRWIYQREARLLADFEAVAADRARVTTVVNQREAESLEAVAPGAAIRAVPNGIDVSSFRPPRPPACGARIVFAGVMDYRPNEEGALWLAEEVWPAVRAARPDARLVLLGANPTRALRQLRERDPSIEVTGTVPDVRPYLWNAALAAVPLATARGVQNKVLEAIAAGLPVVLTPIVRDGLPALVEPACLVAGDRESFAAALIARLANTPAERRAYANAADLSSLDWSTQLAPLLDLIDRPAATSRRPIPVLT